MLGCHTTDRASLGPAGTATPIRAASRSRRPGDAGSAQATDGAASAVPPLKLVAASARVSSDRQDKAQTIDSQIEALRRGAAERGLLLAAEMIFTDDGYSGARLDRLGLDRLRDLVSEGGCAALLVHAPDRPARSFAYQVVLLEEFRHAGCELIFLNHAFDTSPEQQMLLQMQGVFAAYERTLIQERTRRGRLFAARQGRVNGSGHPPSGDHYIRKSETTPQKLVVNDSEAAIVQ